MNAYWFKYLPVKFRSYIEGRHNLQNVISNTVWLFGDKIIRQGIGIFVMIWLARYLGPAQYGLLNYAIAFVSLFSAIATLGLNGIVVRNIVHDPLSKNEILGTTFILKFIGGIVVLCFSLLAIILLRPSDNLLHWLVAIIAAGMIFQSFDTIDLWFQSQIQSKFTVIAKNVAFILATIITGILILITAPLITFAIVKLLELFLGAVGLMIMYRITGNFFKIWQFNFDRAKNLLNDSWPLILSGFAILIQARIDQVMLAEMIGDKEVGLYSVAMRLIEGVAFIPMIVSYSIAPVIAKAKQKSEQHYRDRLLNTYRLMFLFFIVVALPIFLFGKQLVIILFGEEYSGAGVLLSLFAIRLFFTNFGVTRTLFITNDNLFKYSLLTTISGAIINISLNFILIPTYASVGAIWATIISFSVTIFIMDLFYSKTRVNFKLMLQALVTPWQVKLN